MKMVPKTDEGWELNKKTKLFVAVNSISGAITKCFKNNIRGCLEDSFPDTTILHFGINNPYSNETPEDIASNILNLEIFLKLKIKI